MASDFTLTFYKSGRKPGKHHGENFWVVLENEETKQRTMERASYNHEIGKSQDYEYAGFDPWVFEKGSLSPGEKFVAWSPLKFPEGEI